MCDDSNQHQKRFQIEDDPPRTPGLGGTKFKMSGQSSFKLFSSQQRSRLTALYPFLTAEQVNRKVLTMWSKLSSVEKKEFGSGNISSTWATPKRISKISVLCTPRLTTKRLKTDNLRLKAQSESANKTFDFDFLSPEVPVKALYLRNDLRQVVPVKAGAKAEKSKPKVLSNDCNTSNISMGGTPQGTAKNNKSSSPKVQIGRTKSEPTLPNTRRRSSPKPCALSRIDKECDPTKLNTPQENASRTLQDNTSGIPQEKSSSYDDFDFELIDKENLLVETHTEEGCSQPFRPKWGELTFSGRPFNFVMKYATPEVVDETPSEKPGILRKSAENPKLRRVSFSETELQSVISFQQESSQESTDTVEVTGTVDSAENREESGIEVVRGMAIKVTNAVNGPCQVGGENEMMRRAAFYANLMADVNGDMKENDLDFTQVASLNERKGREKLRGRGRGRHKRGRSEAKRGRKGRGRGSVRTRSVLNSQQDMSLSDDRVEHKEDGLKNEFHHGNGNVTALEEKTAKVRRLPRAKKSGYYTRGRGRNGKKLTGARNLSNSKGAGEGYLGDLSVFDLSESETDEPVARKKPGRSSCQSGVDDCETDTLEMEARGRDNKSKLRAVIFRASNMNARATDLDAEVQEVATEKYQDIESCETEIQSTDGGPGNNPRLNDEAKIKSGSEAGTACLVSQWEGSQLDLKEDAKNRMENDGNGKAMQQEKGGKTEKLQQDCSEPDKKIESNMEIDTVVENVAKTVKKIGERKKRRAVGCVQTIETGIEEIGDDGSTEKKQGEETRNVGYGLRKRPRRELADSLLRNRRRTRSGEKIEQQGSLVLSTNKVVTVAEVHAVLDRNDCENSFDVDHEIIGNNGGGGDADQSDYRREKKADDDTDGEVSEFPIVAEETNNQQRPRRSRDRRRLQENVPTPQEEKTSNRKSKFTGPENPSASGEDKFHKISSVDQEVEQPNDQRPNVLHPISDIASAQEFCRHEELMTPSMARAPVNVELVTPMTDGGLTAEIDNLVQLVPRKDRSDQNEDRLRTPVTGITTVPGNELELVTPMTDVGLIQEIQNQVKLAPRKGRCDPIADLTTPLIGTILVPSNELELVTPMTDVKLIEKIQTQVQLAPKKDKSCSDCQEHGHGDHQISGKEEIETDSSNATRKLWDDLARQATEGDGKHSKWTKAQYEGKHQSLKTPESVSCLPDARKVKEPTGLAEPSVEQSQESNQSSLTLQSVDSFSLDPCDIFDSSPPDHQTVAMTMKQTADFSVAQAVRRMQMIGCDALISPVSTILSASLSGVSRLSSMSSVASCDGDVLDDEEDTATLPKQRNEDIKEFLTNIDDESQEQNSLDDPQLWSPSTIETSGGSGVWQGALHNPSNHGNNKPDGDLCDMFQNMTPPKSVKKSGRRLIASNLREGDNEICNLFEDDSIFL